jgi:hypothetical protein
VHYDLRVEHELQEHATPDRMNGDVSASPLSRVGFFGTHGSPSGTAYDAAVTHGSVGVKKIRGPKVYGGTPVFRHSGAPISWYDADTGTAL